MDRSVFVAMLESVDGARASGSGFAIQEDVRLSIHVGSPGDGLVINEVDKIETSDAFATLVSRNDGTTYLVAYDDLNGVSFQPPKGQSSRRAGFS